MKKKLLYILTTAVIAVTAFTIGRNTNGHDNINLNTVIDYVPVNDGIILHTVDRTGRIDGYGLEIPCGIHEWKEKGYYSLEE